MWSLSRTLPRIVLPVLIGLGAAYFVTGFAPRPQPTLIRPKQLLARGLAYSDESPLRAILERNVLDLESAPFVPTGPSALSAPPDAADAAASGAAADEEPFVAPQRSAFDGLRPGPAVTGGVRSASRPADVGIKGFRLVGVIAGGASPLAMLQVAGRPVDLRPGESAGGWTLTAVRPDSAVFRRGAETRRLPLEMR